MIDSSETDTVAVQVVVCRDDTFLKKSKDRKWNDKMECVVDFLF